VRAPLRAGEQRAAGTWRRGARAPAPALPFFSARAERSQPSRLAARAFFSSVARPGASPTRTPSSRPRHRPSSPALPRNSPLPPALAAGAGPRRAPRGPQQHHGRPLRPGGQLHGPGGRAHPAPGGLHPRPKRAGAHPGESRAPRAQAPGRGRGRTRILSYRIVLPAISGRVYGEIWVEFRGGWGGAVGAPRVQAPPAPQHPSPDNVPRCLPPPIPLSSSLPHPPPLHRPWRCWPTCCRRTTSSGAARSSTASCSPSSTTRRAWPPWPSSCWATPWPPRCPTWRTTTSWRRSSCSTTARWAWPRAAAPRPRRWPTWRAAAAAAGARGGARSRWRGPRPGSAPSGTPSTGAPVPGDSRPGVGGGRRLRAPRRRLPSLPPRPHTHACPAHQPTNFCASSAPPPASHVPPTPCPAPLLPP
jgi:hypothetical protein